MDKLTTLIQQARQRPDRISPELLKRLNGHLSATGQPLIFVPPAEPAAASIDPTGNELEQIKASYKREMDHFAANPAEFTNDEHSRMYRMRALISMSESAQKL
jgi:hypothetical protein